METLPVEIWNLIFSYACIDNGFTGRSLSLVSKFVRETSKLSKLQSLSVIGYEQLVGLASLLEETPETFRHVRYIFISAHARRTASDPRALTPEYARRDKAYAAFRRILVSISPTVEILHAFFIFYRPFPLLPVSLPVLHELTLHGPLESHGDVDVLQMIQFPRLRHLHLTSFYSPAYLQRIIVRFTPALVYLRICAPEHSQTFVNELQGTLEGEPSPSSDGETSATETDGDSRPMEMFPPNIEKIFVHCPIEPKDNWMDMMSIYQRTMEALQRLSKQHNRLVLLSPLRFGLFRNVSIQDAEMAWTDSISGRCSWLPDQSN